MVSAMGIGSLWWSWAWPMFWQVMVLVLLVALVDRLIRSWAWPQVRLALWWVVILKLIIPPTFALGTSLTSAAFDRATVPYTVLRAAGMFDDLVGCGGLLVPALEGSAPTSDWAHARSQWPVAVGVIWLLGVLLLSGLLLIRYRSLRRAYLARPARRTLPSWLDAMARSAARQLGMNRTPEVVLTSAIDCPAVLGVFHPVVLLPTDVPETLSRTDLRHALLHEFAHIRRRDPVIQAMIASLQILYWFVPLVWWVGRRMHGLRELACDATVARTIGDSRDYRQFLVDAARRVVARVRVSALEMALFEREVNLLSRLKALDRDGWRHQRTANLTALLIIAAMVLYILPMGTAVVGCPT